jgi:hypothetical protein
MIKEKQKPINQSAKPKTQVVGVRLPVSDWHRLEIKCIENNKTMSEIIRGGINTYLKECR